MHNNCFEFDEFQRIHSVLNEDILNLYRSQSTDEIVDSLLNGIGRKRMKVTSDGRLFNGNHRIEALKERGYDLSQLRSQLDSTHFHSTDNPFIPPGLE